MHGFALPRILGALGVALALVSGWQKAGDDLYWPFFVGALVAFVLSEVVRRTQQPSRDASAGDAALRQAPPPDA